MVEVIQTELSTGTTLCGGKYVIEKKIGAGGFGITYVARHTTLDRKYAIKEFFMSGYNVRNNTTNHVSLQGLEAKDFDRIRQNFINEARTLAQLNNGAIVKVIDIFDENGTSYMVMPFVEGVTLQSMVERDGPMEYAMAVNYIVQICEALTYIHSKSILHRDVTPDNVIVTPEQKIVLIDFGSARKFIDGKTQRHTTIVKPGYAPLEQHSARSRKGAFTDIYSVGAVFYYLMTGERPMDATERVLEKMKEPVELNPNVPAQINAIIMKAMEMDGEMRYQSAKELIDDIFSDDPANGDEDADNVATIKETDDYAPKGMAAETQKDTLVSVSNPPRFSDDAGGNSMGTDDEKDSEYYEKAKEDEGLCATKSTPKKDKSVTPLKLMAIVSASIALIVVAVVSIYHFHSLSNQHQKPEDTTHVSDSSLLAVAEPTLDSLMQQMMQQNSETIIQELMDGDSKDPVVLYAVAKKAYDGVSSNMMNTFWDEVLVMEGDVDRHLTASKETFSRSKFAFVCGARAYENISDSDYHTDVKQELRSCLTDFLDELRQIDTTVLIYEKIQ